MGTGLSPDDVQNASDGHSLPPNSDKYSKIILDCHDNTEDPAHHLVSASMFAFISSFPTRIMGTRPSIISRSFLFVASTLQLPPSSLVGSSSYSTAEIPIAAASRRMRGFLTLLTHLGWQHCSFLQHAHIYHKAALCITSDFQVAFLFCFLDHLS